MYLENVVTDATDPQRLGRFWEAALGTAPLTDEPAGYETRLAVAGGPELDLGFQRVPEPPTGPQRLWLQLRGGPQPEVTVQRLLRMGARRAGAGDDEAAAIALTDPAGNRFRVLAGPSFVEDGPIASLSLAVADPDRERDFWAWLTGWVPLAGLGAPALRHPSGRGPLLELRLEDEPKREGKNRIHLDVRLEPGDDAAAVFREVVRRGGRELHADGGRLPWRSFLDPSGNELCLLPSR